MSEANESDASEPRVAVQPGDLMPGDLVDAVVVALTTDGVRLRLGEEEKQAVVSKPTVTEPVQLAPGDEVRLFVEQVEPVLIVSPEKAGMLRLWDRLAAAAESGEVVDGTVVAIVKGGLAVDVGTKAFLPASEVDVRRTSDLGRFVGQRLPFKVLRFGTKRGNVVLSRRPIVAAEREALEKTALDGLALGDVRTGTVKSFTSYGAFVDLGGLDGLLHVSDMSWSKVSHPSQLLKVGESVTVKVLAIDAAKRRVSIGTKQLTADPWETIADSFGEGVDVSGKVMRLADFGAFVELAAGIEGLVHVSEMSWSRGIRPSDVVKAGDAVRVRVLRLDLKERRIALGMKQLLPNPWRAFAEEHPAGSKVTGTVKSLTDFGIFVRVADGLDGLVHVSDFSWTERVRDPSERYKKGDEVTAVVLDVDVDNERIALGVKQLEADPWVTLADRFPAGTKIMGKVMRIVDFGAFIEIEPGSEGLCHISELSHERVESVSDKVKIGDTLEVVVLDIDASTHKISLSAKAVDAMSSVEEPPAEETPAKAPAFSNTLGDKLAKQLGIEPKA